MLTIKTKQYEIEEKIQLLNDKDEVIYEFDMKLTSDDLKELKNALIGKDTLKLASKIKKMEALTLDEKDINNVLEMSDELNSTAENLISKLCFREHKEKFIELGGIAKYEEMQEVISDYLLSFFIKRQSTRANTINTDLAKIINR